MEVESKFNPDDWNGYLHTYETIEEYNAARKLLPHTARIESTKEAKYIPRTQAGLPELYMDVDNIKDVFGTEFQEMYEYEQAYRNQEFSMAYKVYKLIGELEIPFPFVSRFEKRYLWELCYDDEGINQMNAYRRYVFSSTIEQGIHITADRDHLRKCYIITANHDQNIETYDVSTDLIQDAERGDPVYNVIYSIHDNKYWF